MTFSDNYNSLPYTPKTIITSPSLVMPNLYHCI